MPASIIAYAIFLRNILCILFKMFCAVVRSIFMGCPPVKTYFPFLFSELLLTLSQQQLASELYWKAQIISWLIHGTPTFLAIFQTLKNSLQIALEWHWERQWSLHLHRQIPQATYLPGPRLPTVRFDCSSALWSRIRAKKYPVGFPTRHQRRFYSVFCKLLSIFPGYHLSHGQCIKVLVLWCRVFSWFSSCELLGNLVTRASEIWRDTAFFQDASMTPILLAFRLYSYFYYFWIF